MNYVHFAAEFHGNKFSFSQKSDVTYWEGIGFFKTKRKAASYANKLIKENIRVGLKPNVFNKLVKLNNLMLPYVCLNKYKVQGKVTNDIHIVIIQWENQGMRVSNVLKCFASKEDAIKFVESFDVKEHKPANSYEAKVYISSHNVY